MENELIDKGSYYAITFENKFGKESTYKYSKCCKVPIVDIGGMLRCGKWDCPGIISRESRQEVKTPGKPGKAPSHGLERKDLLAGNAWVKED